MKVLLGIVFLAAVAVPADYTLWSSSDLKSKDKGLASKATPQAAALEQLENYGNHLTMLAHRKGDGEVEIHDAMADIFVVRSGDATLVVGGKASGGRSTGPGETRGGTITGGQRQKLSPGDIVHIPAGVPHQLLLPKGSDFSYFIIKVKKP